MIAARVEKEVEAIKSALKDKDVEIGRLRSESVAPVAAAAGSNSGSSSSRIKRGRNASQSAEDGDTSAAVASTKGAPIKSATHIKLLKDRIDNNKDKVRLFDPYHVIFLFWLYTFRSLF